MFLREDEVLSWHRINGHDVLALPAKLPGRAEIITVSFAVVTFSVFVQGLTMPPLLRANGEIPVQHNEEVRPTPHGMSQGG